MRGLSRRPRPAAALALALVVSGCSFRLVQPAPPRSEWPDPVLPSSSQVRCTESYLPPAADLTFAAITGTLAYVERDSGAPQVALLLGITSIPLLVSGIYGLVKVSSCRSYQARFREAAP
jgi:hypothetical protein